MTHASRTQPEDKSSARSGRRRSELDAAAALAHRVAPALCTHGCADYHGTVDFMRLLDLVGSPEMQIAFYHDAIGVLARQGARDVLVSGCADHAMLETVVEAFALAAAGTPAVTVVDLCPTPLLLCRSWAASQPVAIETEERDAAALGWTSRFDVVATDSLLTLIPPERRSDVARSWFEALRPGGAVVTTCRLKPGGVAEPPSAERAERFQQLARERLAAGASVAGMENDVLTDAARRFASSVGVFPISDRAELSGLLTGAGFVIERLESWVDEGLMAAGQAVAGARRPATYAQVVARRP